MLKINNQLELNFSKYQELYDILIDENNIWKEKNLKNYIHKYIKSKQGMQNKKNNYNYGVANFCGKL